MRCFLGLPPAVSALASLLHLGFPSALLAACGMLTALHEACTTKGRHITLSSNTSSLGKVAATSELYVSLCVHGLPLSDRLRRLMWRSTCSAEERSSILLLPIYFAVFGISRWAIIVLIIDYSIFFLIVSTTTAIRGVNKEIVEMSKVFGASERQQLRSIYLPSAAPVVFGALRIALGRAIKGMINGELFIAVIGIGARSQGFARRFDMEGVFALAILVVGVALILGFILNLIDGRVNKWVPSIRRNG
jgi:ABC-type nitrate/sulfonate/bicarbonate transport system permease component